jgi:hypothetical protein
LVDFAAGIVTSSVDHAHPHLIHARGEDREKKALLRAVFEVGTVPSLTAAVASNE